MNTVDRITSLARHYGLIFSRSIQGGNLHEVLDDLDRKAGIKTATTSFYKACGAHECSGWRSATPVGARVRVHENHIGAHLFWLGEYGARKLWNTRPTDALKAENQRLRSALAKIETLDASAFPDDADECFSAIRTVVRAALTEQPHD